MQSKRILIPLLAVLLICLLAGTSTVSAAGTYPVLDFELAITVETENAITEDPLVVTPGDTLTVSVAVASNQGAGMAEFTLLYDTNAVDVVMNGDKLAYTTHDDVFVASAYNKNISVKEDGEILVRYMNGPLSDKTGDWVTFSFIVKEGYHGDIRFDFSNIIAISADTFGIGTGMQAYAGVHNFKGEPVISQVTCTEDGTKTYHCDTCDEDVVIITDLAAGHNLTEHAEKTVTCEEDGNSAYWSCDVCEKAFSDAAATVEVDLADVIDTAPGHNWQVSEGREATCTVDGLTEGKVCTNCQTVETEQTTITAPGHKWVIDEAVEPTTSSEGKTEGKHCEVCGEIAKAQEVIPKTSLAWLWILIAIVVVAAAGVVAYFFIFKKKVKRY